MSPLAELLNPELASGVVQIPEAHFVVTYRTRDGGHHKLEHFTATTHHPEVRREVFRYIARRFSLSFVEPGTLAVQRVRR